MMSLPAMLEWGRAAAAEVATPDVASPMAQPDKTEPVELERLPTAFAAAPTRGGSPSAGTAEGVGRT